MFLARCVHRWVAMDQPRNDVAHRGIGGLWKLSRWVQPLAAIEYSHRRKTWFFGTPRSRGPLAGWTFYKGTQWIAFNRRAAETVLGTDPAVTAWFSHGHIADETYLQTVLYHEPGLDVRQAVVTYVPEMVKPPQGGVTRWMVLDHEDLPAVWASGAAFARKVDQVERPSVIRAIDAEVDRRRALVPEARARRRDPLRTRPPADRLGALRGRRGHAPKRHLGHRRIAGRARPRRSAARRPRPGGQSNERGHWESDSVQHQHARPARGVGATAYAPPAQQAGRADAFDGRAARGDAVVHVASAGRPLVLKDPRLCLTLPLWRSAIPARLGAVLVLRDPEDVARSLQARDDMPVMLGLAMWDRYVRSAAGGSGRPADARRRVRTRCCANPVKASRVDERLPRAAWASGPGPRRRTLAAGRLDPSLRHQDADRDDYDDVCAPLRDVLGVLAERRRPPRRLAAARPSHRRHRGWTTCCAFGVSSHPPDASCTG